MSLQPDRGYLRVCPGDRVEVNCSSTETVLHWKLNIPDKNICQEAHFTFKSTQNYTLYKFVLKLMSANSSGGPGIVSSARVEDVGPSINGSVLTCSSSLAEFPQANEMASITIVVEGR